MTRGIKQSLLAALVSVLWLAGITGATAEVVSNDRLTFPFAAFDACNNELIVGTIDGHLVRTVEQRGGCQEFGVHTNMHGAAEGAVSGNPYVINIEEHDSQIVCPPCAGELTFQQKTLLISQGRLPNQVVTISFTCPLREGCGSCVLDCKKPVGEVECRGAE